MSPRGAALGRAVRFGPEGGAGTGQPDDRRRQPTGERCDQKSRVARVADFARWAEQVTATADDTEPQTKRVRKRAGRTERRVTAAAVSDITTAEGSRRDGRRRIRPSKEASQAVRRRSSGGYTSDVLGNASV